MSFEQESNTAVLDQEDPEALQKGEFETTEDVIEDEDVATEDTTETVEPEPFVPEIATEHVVEDTHTSDEKYIDKTYSERIRESDVPLDMKKSQALLNREAAYRDAAWHYHSADALKKEIAREMDKGNKEAVKSLQNHHDALIRKGTELYVKADAEYNAHIEQEKRAEEMLSTEKVYQNRSKFLKDRANQMRKQGQYSEAIKSDMASEEYRGAVRMEKVNPRIDTLVPESVVEIPQTKQNSVGILGKAKSLFKKWFS